MSRTLWTVLADQQPVAIVAAEAAETAWRIVTALTDHYDLPRRSGIPTVVPCPPSQCQETLTRARELGCGDSFVACVRGGMFLTHIDGLALA